MNLHSSLVSVYLVILMITTFSCLHVCHCAGSDGGGVEENSVEEADEQKEGDHDDKLISQLLDTPIGNPDEDSEVSRILKILEAAEQATSTTTTTTTTTTSTTTTPKPTTSAKPTTTTESPFFKTERPATYSARSGKPGDLDEMIRYLDVSFKEAQQELGTGDENEDHNGTKISRRSDYHHYHTSPSVRNLFWHTARAVWDVSRPVFYRTHVGRKVALARDTFSLPLRTFGAIRHTIHDLTHHPYGDRKHRSPHHHHHDAWGWDHDDDHHHHHRHGWGWDSAPVYVKYEPENSLFKAWLRYLYRALRPAIMTKIRLKRRLLRTKLRFIGRLVRFLKTVKLQKIIAYIRDLRERLHPNIVVLKATGTTEAPGWGWDSHKPEHGWHVPSHGWDSDGWIQGKPPTAAPAPKYGPPKYTPPPAPSYEPIGYGPPVMNHYGGYQKSWNTPPKSATTEQPSPIAYNKENTYSNYYAQPSQWLKAPEQMMAQASASDQHETNEEPGIEIPSYAHYLKQFGINPASLADNSPESTQEQGIRHFRQSDKVSLKNTEELPYLVSESSDDETAKIGEAQAIASRM